MTFTIIVKLLSECIGIEFDDIDFYCIEFDDEMKRKMCFNS